MGEAMGLDRVIALEIEKRLDEAVAGGIAIDDSIDVGAKGLCDSGSRERA